jgi:hypothetical protein
VVRKETRGKNTRGLDSSSDSDVGSSSSDEIDVDESDYINNKFSSKEQKRLLKKMRQTIAYVYIRAHSALPYDDDEENKFNEYTMPSDMNLTKITSAVNGTTNCSFYDYQDKKDLIGAGIEKYDKTTNKKSDKAAKSIQTELRNYEKEHTIPNWENRNILSSEKTVLNKIIVPYSAAEVAKRKITDYIATQILFSDDSSRPGYFTFSAFDIYQLVHEKYRKSIRRYIVGHNEAIKIADIIKFLYDDLKLRNVVLLDFSCSSYQDDVPLANQEALTKYLNKNNLHGGIKKTMKNKKKYMLSRKSRKYKGGGYDSLTPRYHSPHPRQRPPSSPRYIGSPLPKYRSPSPYYRSPKRRRSSPPYRSPKPLISSTL